MGIFKILPRARFDKYNKAHDGYPIWFRIVVNGTERWEESGLFIKNKNQWDKHKRAVVKRLDAEIMNTAINNKRTELRTKIVSLMANQETVSMESLQRKEIKSFFIYARGVRGDNEITNKYINRIKKFHKREPRLGEITVEWLRRYENHQRDVWKNAPETIHCNMKFLRRILNQALAEEYLKTKIFGKLGYMMPDPGKSMPVFLVREERTRLLNYFLADKITNPTDYKVCLYFLLCCYSGLRYSDACRFDPTIHIQGNDIVLRTAKTGGLVTYGIGKSLSEIIERIRKVGPLGINYEIYRTRLKEIGKIEGLKLTKELKSHVGRHTFGRMMAEEKVPESDCAHWMGITTAMVKIYYHITDILRKERNAHLRDL
jgi:integrase